MRRRIFSILVFYTFVCATLFALTAMVLRQDFVSILIGFLGVLGLLCIFCTRITERIVREVVDPVNNIQPDSPLQSEAFDEFTPLIRKLYAHHVVHARYKDELSRRKLEFDALANSMSEGLIILNGNSAIMSCNRAAISLLHVAQGDYTGVNLQHLTRDTTLHEAVARAINGEQNDYLIEHDHRFLRFFLSPVEVDAILERGVVILIVDISAQYQAERSRREFTANVSHELKTPLTSVIGYAELLKAGMVLPNDIPQFVERIHTEASHLLSLVDDIIKLSRLDEKASRKDFAPVDLHEMAHMAVDRLTQKAQDNQVTLAVTGQPCEVIGRQSLLLDLLTNLCDNAIKYNRPQGTVTIDTLRTLTGARITITDTGYGIPAADQPHVFERFYRADKSRSREVGGTGLGLSIVKHICELHGAQVTLTSSSAGTCFTVVFAR